MEHFDEKQGIREKSLYTFHLDTPRIVIAVSVFLGIVALTFLLGMTFTKGDKVDSESLTASDLLAPGKHDLNRFDRGLLAQNEPAEVVHPNTQVAQAKSSDAGNMLASNKPVNDSDLFPLLINDSEPAMDGIPINNSSKREKDTEKKKDNKKKSKTIAKESTTSDRLNVKKDAAKTK